MNRQDFSHRAADERSLLDEVLRRGRGERRGRAGMLNGLRLVGGNSRTVKRGFSLWCAQHLRSHGLSRLRTGLNSSTISVVDYLAILLRLGEAWPFGNKAGASTAAIGTARTVFVDELCAAKVFIGEFRELPQCFEQIRDLRRRGRSGRLLQD